MKQLLIVAHCPSNNTHRLGEALLEGAENEIGEAASVQAHLQSPFNTSPQDLLKADGLVLLTTENFGYMSGAMKDMFDRCYYEVIDHARGKPYCLVVRAGKDGTGTIRACESIIKGLGWNKVQDVTLLQGEFQEDFVETCKVLTEGFAAGLESGIF